MSEHDTFKVRCRALIIHDGKMFVVKHAENATFWALPGGHLESGEGIEEGLVREITEELGIVPVIDRLVYVQTFKIGDQPQSVEFIFSVANGAEYLDLSGRERSHAFELVDMKWTTPDDDIVMMPKKVGDDFKSKVPSSENVVFINQV